MAKHTSTDARWSGPGAAWSRRRIRWPRPPARASWRRATFDAIAATAAVLNVVEPFMSGLAGLGMATVFTARDKQVRALDFHPPVPVEFDGSKLTNLDKRDGLNASGVPGNLAGWCFLVEELGTMPLERIRAGDPPRARGRADRVLRRHGRDGRGLGHAAGMAAGLCRPTQNATLDTVLVQPELAETYRRSPARGRAISTAVRSARRWSPISGLWAGACPKPILKRSSRSGRRRSRPPTGASTSTPRRRPPSPSSSC